ncbi:MAG: hypothetical protein QW212_00690 [Nitrososphaerales archaeon]
MNTQFLWWTTTVIMVAFGLGLVFPSSPTGIFIVLLGCISGYFYYKKYLKRGSK